MIKWIVIAFLSMLLIATIFRWIWKRKHSSFSGLSGERSEAVEFMRIEPEEMEAADGKEIFPTKTLPLSTEVLRHYAAMFGAEGEVRAEEHQPVPIAIYPPTRKRGWWTYATAGLHQAGGIELLLYSYKRETDMITHLLEVSRHVRTAYEEKGMTIDVGDQFVLEAPIVAASRMNHVIVVPLSFEEDGFAHYFNGEQMYSFLALLPVTAEEAAFLRSYGWDALVERFVTEQINALDLHRDSSVDGGEIHGTDSNESKRGGRS
ncbi:suppressor of fused domain protein [Brevibacillus migulae]|uniref:suppressor of fused domain protein n=1 Tax=Brevibacillus migulae TaxID=1644114 RepID=UPI00106F065D|nr:suppressor of fused domain protein [Brevibacillus migulae]